MGSPKKMKKAQRLTNLKSKQWFKSTDPAAQGRISKQVGARNTNYKYLNNQIQGVLGERDAAKALGATPQKGNSFFDLMSEGKSPTEVRTRQVAQVGEVMKKAMKSKKAMKAKNLCCFHIIIYLINLIN